MLFVLVAYRLLSPGSEWRLHRQWFERSALKDLLGVDERLGDIRELYADREKKRPNGTEARVLVRCRGGAMSRDEKGALWRLSTRAYRWQGRCGQKVGRQSDAAFGVARGSASAMSGVEVGSYGLREFS